MPTTGSQWASYWSATSPLTTPRFETLEEHASTDVEKMVLGNKYDSNNKETSVQGTGRAAGPGLWNQVHGDRYKGQRQRKEHIFHSP